MAGRYVGICLRRVFAARFAQASAECEREQLPISLVMLDIGHFKKINDYWGHASGDIVLRASRACGWMKQPPWPKS
ncbi:hypothetical protein AWV80_16360 [Cupriavidus sp. UYMU48A]|nr:hypothetical protein AWV80_16360 [Cupriavidus sp. UYMU48A]